MSTTPDETDVATTSKPSQVRDDEKKVAKRRRTTAKSKFTRLYNILYGTIDTDEPNIRI